MPSPIPQQIARDQAEAIRLARLAAGGDVGVTNSESTQENSVEQGEIPPVNSVNQVAYVDPPGDGRELARSRSPRRGVPTKGTLPARSCQIEIGKQ